MALIEGCLLLFMSMVQPLNAKVISVDVRGRLLCDGKPHGKNGLGGWPKRVQLWDALNNVVIKPDGGFEEISNRRGTFRIRGREATQIPMQLIIYHHCYSSPLQECYKVHRIPIPRNTQRILHDFGGVELLNTVGVFVDRNGQPCETSD
ncbi:hypothetical protein AB6A40_001811 [Gnathostoma spinigerum]|uniref:Transthyretin-like family protein n=1 Tax=Gnathostoma spinigerum TaxID=75299 RepID=A0ABD6E772_9BILA